MSSPYALYGRALIENGYCALPCRPGTKMPGDYSGGQWHGMSGWSTKYVDRKPSDFEIRRWTNNFQDAGICIALGKSSGGLIAIDVDADDVVDAVKRALPATPVSKRGKKGLTLFFRGEIKSTAFNRQIDGNIERIVDVLAEGKQTVIPPTIHPDTGKPYVWVGGSLLDYELADLPEIPENALDLLEVALKPHGYDPSSLRHTAAVASVREKPNSGFDESTPYAQLNKAAINNLGLWVPDLNLYNCLRVYNGYHAVNVWRQSSTGRDNALRSRNLKIIHGEGIKDHGSGDTFSPIDLVQRAFDMGSHTYAFDWLCEKLNWAPTIDMIVSPGFLKRAEEKILADRARKTQPVADPPEPAPAFVEAPSVDLQCPGFVGRVADWITQTAPVQQPELSLAAALVLTATLAGRRLQGPTEAGLHLYALMLGGSGEGKDHPNKAIRSILKAINKLDLGLGGNFSSGIALIKCLAEHPSSYAFIDEAGSALFAKGKGKNAASFERSISETMRRAWSTNPGEDLPSDEKASERSITIYSPSFNMLCASTREELFEAVDNTIIMNGFLNRFILFSSNDKARKRTPPISKNDVPEDIKDMANMIYSPDNLRTSPFRGKGTTPLEARATVVPWADEAAKAEYDAIDDQIFEMKSTDPGKANFFARAQEYSIRLATVRAVGIDALNPKVTVEDVRWAWALVARSLGMMMDDAKNHLSENDFHKNKQRVVRYLIKRKGDLVEVREIQSYMRGALKAPLIRELCDDLIEEGRVERVIMSDKGRARYKLIA